MIPRPGTRAISRNLVLTFLLSTVDAVKRRAGCTCHVLRVYNACTILTPMRQENTKYCSGRGMENCLPRPAGCRLQLEKTNMYLGYSSLFHMGQKQWCAHKNGINKSRIEQIQSYSRRGFPCSSSVQKQVSKTPMT